MKRSGWMVAALAAMIAAPALAQSSWGTTGHATATIAPPGIVLVRNSSLSFGTIAPSAAPGSVRVAPDSTMSTVGGVSVVVNGFAAAFTASSTHPSNQFFWVEVPDNSTVYLTRPASPSLLMHSFTVSANVPLACVKMTGVPAPPNSAKNSCPSVSSATTFTFQVGATLNIPAAPPPGTYTGTFPITIHRF